MKIKWKFLIVQTITSWIILSQIANKDDFISVIIAVIGIIVYGISNFMEGVLFDANKD